MRQTGLRAATSWITDAMPWTTTAAGRPDMMRSAYEKLVAIVISSSSPLRGIFRGNSSAITTPEARSQKVASSTGNGGPASTMAAKTQRPTRLTAQQNRRTPFEVREFIVRSQGEGAEDGPASAGPSRQLPNL